VGVVPRQQTPENKDDKSKQKSKGDMPLSVLSDGNENKENEKDKDNDDGEVKKENSENEDPMHNALQLEITVKEEPLEWNDSDRTEMTIQPVRDLKKNIFKYGIENYNMFPKLFSFYWHN